MHIFTSVNPLIAVETTFNKRVEGLGLYTTFNNSSVTSWLSVLLVEVTGVPGEKRDLPQINDT